MVSSFGNSRYRFSYNNQVFVYNKVLLWLVIPRRVYPAVVVVVVSRQLHSWRNIQKPTHLALLLVEATRVQQVSKHSDHQWEQCVFSYAALGGSGYIWKQRVLE